MHSALEISVSIETPHSAFDLKKSISGKYLKCPKKRRVLLMFQKKNLYKRRDWSFFWSLPHRILSLFLGEFSLWRLPRKLVKEREQRFLGCLFNISCHFHSSDSFRGSLSNRNSETLGILYQRETPTTTTPRVLAPSPPKRSPTPEGPAALPQPMTMALRHNAVLSKPSPCPSFSQCPSFTLSVNSSF